MPDLIPSRGAARAFSAGPAARDRLVSALAATSLGRRFALAAAWASPRLPFGGRLRLGQDLGQVQLHRVPPQVSRR